METLLLGDKTVADSHDFKGIAVSSAAWLRIEEVKESHVLQYLRTMRSKGYLVVGLEQSDGSQSLKDCQLPSPCKCVLLLGKEREGIPPDLLTEVDVCLEIPQFGVVRSLNVHVSAALAIWEITQKNWAILNAPS